MLQWAPNIMLRGGNYSGLGFTYERLWFKFLFLGNVNKICLVCRREDGIFILLRLRWCFGFNLLWMRMNVKVINARLDGLGEV